MGMREALIREKLRREKERRNNAMTGNPEIIEETHDDVSFADRAIVKNFSQSPEKSANYIAKHNPQLDTRVWDGRVLVKSKGDTKWNVLDPDTGFFSKDMLGDAADIAYDVGSTVAEGAALVGGSIAGTPLAGAAASAATSAGSEALRQGIGGALGVDNELGEAAGDVAMMGAIGGIIPGAGKLLKPAMGAAKYAGKKGVNLLTQATGKDVDILLNKSDDIDKLIDGGFTEAHEAIGRNAKDAVKAEKLADGSLFQEFIKSGRKVDLSEAVKKIDDRVGELKAKGSLRPSEQTELDKLVEFKKNHFSLNDGQMFLKKAPIDTTSDIKREMGDIAFEQMTTASNKGSQRLASGIYDKLNKALDEAAGDLGTKEARAKYRATLQLEEFIDKYLNNNQKIESTIKAAGKGKNKTILEGLQKVDATLGTNLMEQVDLLDTARFVAQGGRDSMPFSRATVLDKLTDGEAAKKYLDVIRKSTDGIGGLDEAAREKLKKELYKRITTGDALREALKAGVKLDRDRG